jgi:hypothetical protein
MRLFLIALSALALSSPCLAAGAIAAGPCDDTGYAFGYFVNARSANAAEEHALRECRMVETTDKTGACQIVASVEDSGLCIAFAADRSQACGATGVAYAPSLSRAQSMAINFCRKYGGADCTIKVAKCDVYHPPTGGGGITVPTITLNPACGNPPGSRPSSCVFK